MFLSFIFYFGFVYMFGFFTRNKIYMHIANTWYILLFWTFNRPSTTYILNLDCNDFIYMYKYMFMHIAVLLVIVIALSLNT